MSNYTASIEFNNESNVKLKFLSQQLNNRAFIGSQLIKNDLKNYTANETELINVVRLKYFDHRLKEMEAKKIINVDLKNAYASVLFNDGFISEKTYLYLLTLPKKDRLAAVGIIAYKKEVFKYSQGQMIEYTTEKGEYSNVFFYCVRKTALIMADISKILGNDYLFSWVDGIYFTEIKNKTIEVLEYLEKLNYNYSIETLKNFKSVKKEKHFLINFDKGKENKLFNIPISSYGWQNDFYTWNNNRIKELNELNEKIK